MATIVVAWLDSKKMGRLKEKCWKAFGCSLWADLEGQQTDVRKMT